MQLPIWEVQFSWDINYQRQREVSRGIDNSYDKSLWSITRPQTCFTSSRYLIHRGREEISPTLMHHRLGESTLAVLAQLTLAPTSEVTLALSSPVDSWRAKLCRYSLMSLHYRCRALIHQCVFSARGQRLTYVRLALLTQHLLATSAEQCLGRLSARWHVTCSFLICLVLLNLSDNRCRCPQDMGSHDLILLRIRASCLQMLCIGCHVVMIGNIGRSIA